MTSLLHDSLPRNQIWAKHRAPCEKVSDPSHVALSGLTKVEPLSRDQFPPPPTDLLGHSDSIYLDLFSLFDNRPPPPLYNLLPRTQVHRQAPRPPTPCRVLFSTLLGRVVATGGLIYPWRSFLMRFPPAVRLKLGIIIAGAAVLTFGAVSCLDSGGNFDGCGQAARMVGWHSRPDPSVPFCRGCGFRR